MSGQWCQSPQSAWKLVQIGSFCIIRDSFQKSCRQLTQWRPSSTWMHYLSAPVAKSVISMLTSQGGILGSWQMGRTRDRTIYRWAERSRSSEITFLKQNTRQSEKQQETISVCRSLNFFSWLQGTIYYTCMGILYKPPSPQPSLARCRKMSGWHFRTLHRQ